MIDPETYGETITITAVDDMYKADNPYSTALAYPTTLGDMYRECCNNAGIAFETANFRNSNFVVETAPYVDCTYREMLGYIAMLAVGNARINRMGYMQIVEYDFSALSENSFTGHNLTDWISLKTDTGDATITGVQTTIGNEYDGEKLLAGNDGYVISVKNPLLDGNEQAGLDIMASILIGGRFRKFEGDIPANPTIEFMDAVKITDRKGNVCYSFVTDIDFAFFSATYISNSAESALRNSQTYTAPQNATYQAAKKLVEQERTDREARQEELARELAEGSGMYIDTETQQDGSCIYYLHDKETMASSKNVVKITSDAFGFSTDGGMTYPFGWSVTGDMLAKILSAEGINADWINAGTVSAKRISVNGNTFSDFFDVSIVDGHPVVRIGSSSSAIILKQFNDKIAFYDTSGNLLTYWNNNSFEIVNMSRFRLGSLAMVVQPNGSISFVPAGG